MTTEQEQTLEKMLQIIRESAEEIINKNFSERDLLFFLYEKGFQFIQKQNNQTIVDIGSVGLAYAVMKGCGNDGKNN